MGFAFPFVVRGALEENFGVLGNGGRDRLVNIEVV